MDKEPRVTIIVAEVSDDYAKDILVTCIENDYSHCWFAFRNIVRDENQYITECEVLDIEADDSDDTKWKKITLEDIKRGVTIAVDMKSPIAKSYKNQILYDNNDIISADIVLQAAVLGEVLYS